MSMLLLLIFLFILYPFNVVKGSNVPLEHKCGNTLHTFDTLFSYMSHKANGREVQIHVSQAQIGAGKVGELSLALVDGKCVALKMFKGTDGIEFFENSVQIIIELAQLEASKRVHLINIVDSGYFTIGREKRGLILMEFGHKTLAQHLKKLKELQSGDAAKGHLDEAALKALAKQIVLPLKEFHQVAVHLDVKPENLLYVHDQNRRPVLKLIDFDGAALLGEDESEPPHSGPSKRLANSACTRSTTPIWSDLYVSPETFEQPELSTKADIWALGIMLYEVVLTQKPFHTFTPNWTSWLHKGIVTQNGEFFDYVHFDDKGKWLAIGGSHKAMELMLRTWIAHPWLALLISNTLSLEPTHRMTAIGILNYLEEKCLPEEVLSNAKNVPQLRVFNEFTLLKLTQIFALTQMADLEKLANEAIAKQKAHLNSWRVWKLLKLGVKCDTETTQIAEEVGSRSQQTRFHTLVRKASEAVRAFTKIF